MKFGARAAKAWTGALVALLTGLATGLADERLTTAEVLLALGAALAAFGSVYGVPNAREADPHTSTPDL